MNRLPLRMQSGGRSRVAPRLLPVALALGLLAAALLVAGCEGGRLSVTVASPSPMPVPTRAVPSPPAVATPVGALPGATLPAPTALPTRAVYGSPPSDELLEAMDDMESQIESVRGLELTQPITRSLMTTDELARYMEEEFAREMTPEEIANDVRVFAAFDFFAADYDLRGLLLQLYSSQVIGMYDNEVNSLYVISNEAGIAEGRLNLMDRLTFVHELVHALQDENLGLDAFTDDEAEELDDEAMLARQALVEGDATLAMMQYVFAYPGQITQEDLQSLTTAASDESQAILDAAPAVIRETFMFPYDQGLQFVTTLVEEGGWDAVDDAYGDPPQSSEQILHPEKYLDRDEPQIVTLPPLTDTLGADWTFVETGILGEFQLEIYLDQQVSGATARRASEGWDGDAFAVHLRGDNTLLAFKVAWDSAPDRQEFVEAWRQYAEGKYGQAATGVAPNRECWETPAQTGCLLWADTTSLIVLGPDTASVERVLEVATP